MRKIVLVCLLSVACLLPSIAQVNYKTREEIPDKYKWNFNDIYKSWDEWEADLAAIKNDMDEMLTFKGKLGESANNLIAMMQLQESLMKKAYKAYQYVSFQSTVDTRNTELQGKLQKVQLMFAQFGVSMAWMSPEMIEIPEETMKKWLAENEALKVYEFELTDMYRLQKHVLSEKMEELVSFYSQVTGTAGKVFTALSTADIDFPEVELSTGEKVKVTPGGYSNVVTNNKNQEPL